MPMKRPTAALMIAAMLMPLTACIPGGSGGSDSAPPPPRSGDYYAPDRNYDASRDYRDEQGYDRPLTRDDQVYRGSDGRYYCKRNNGSTGLVAGGLAGGTLGAILGGGGLLGILIGGAAGAVLGKSVDKGEVRCR
jgi:hypothetical protein